MAGMFSSSSKADTANYTSGSQTQQGPSASVVFSQGKNSTGNVAVTLTDHGAVGASLALASETVAANERALALNLAFADAETDDALIAMKASQDVAMSFAAGAFQAAMDATGSAFGSAMGASQGAFNQAMNAVGSAYYSSMNATGSATDKAIAAILAASSKTSEAQKFAYQDSLKVLNETTANARADMEKRSDDTMQKVLKVASLGVGAVALFSWLA
ncbi:MAG: hypothetical protein AMXMBFR26_06920 [Porticoccaceae bacterium]